MLQVCVSVEGRPAGSPPLQYLQLLLLGELELVIQRVLIDVVVLQEVLVVDLGELLLVEFELLPGHRIEYVVPRQQHEHNRKAQQYHADQVHLALELVVEEDLSTESPEEGEVQQAHDFVGEGHGDVVGGAGTVQQVVLVHPVVCAHSDQDGHGSGWDQVHVEESKPHHLQDLGVPLAHTVLVVSHEKVGLLLGHELSALVQPALELVRQLVGVDEPDERHQHRGEDEHEGLLLDNAERVGVVVLVHEGFHSDGHEAGREEHAQGVLEGEGEVIVGLVVVVLQVGEVVQHWTHHELVEEHDSDQSGPGDDSCVGLLQLGVTTLLVGGVHQLLRLEF